MERPFSINPDLNRDELARVYAETGRVRIYGFLNEGAVRLYEELASRPDWIHLISTEQAPLELGRDAKRRLGLAEWERLQSDAHARARTGFQYRYEALAVPPAADAEGDDLLTCFARFLGSEALLRLTEHILGHRLPLAFTDGQATAYGAGDFLTGHDDNVAGKARTAAFVYGLTPRWRPEYGGLLLFHGDRERTVHGLVPRFNTLDLFTVPQQHSVSEVTRAAPHPRYAVTGWLRPAH